MAMIVNTRWLREYLQPAATDDEVLEILPRIGLEVEHHSDLKRELQAVRVGFIRQKKEIEGEKGYYLCQIEIERGKTISVVCASEHVVEVGWGVPVAPAGTTLPTGATIRAEPFHGIHSEGMICLDGEMGLLARDSGMHHFTDETLLGKSLPECIEITEHLVEVNVLANRPDFLGLIGIAREVAAALRLKLVMPKSFAPAAGKGPVPVTIDDPSLCTRYLCGVVNGVGVAPSPTWFKSRLILAGMRPINNVVDVTNYVLYEWGQPLHAFDLATLEGPAIIVRRMKKGETLELLTGKMLSAEGQDDMKFSQPPLVIADAKGPVALAGIMGGRPTQTAGKTTSILLEAARFDPVNIRRTVKEVDLGMENRGTASSYRFERGTDPNLGLHEAALRALQLMIDLAGGSIDKPLSDVYPIPVEPKSYSVTSARVSGYLGMPVDGATITDCLSRLSMQCQEAGNGSFNVQVPTWRVDVNNPVVLIEDVARLVGYDKIPVNPCPASSTLGSRSPLDQTKQRASDFLVSAGFFESRNPSLESPAQSRWLGDPPGPITVANAATKDMSVLRRSLLTGLAATVENNIRRGVAGVQFFEVDRTFNDAPGNGAAPAGRWSLAAVAGGQKDKSNWREAGAEADFYVLKGVLESLFDALGVQGITYRPADVEPYMPGSTASISAGDVTLGLIGEIDVSSLPVDRLTFPLFAFELDVEALSLLSTSLPAYKHLYRQPAVTRDLAIVVPVSKAYVEIASSIRASAGPRLESLQLVDRYQGKQVASGHQSVAFRLVFRDPQVTLTADEVSKTMESIVSTLESQFGAKLRV